MLHIYTGLGESMLQSFLIHFVSCKKFSYSFICGNDYSPPFGGEQLFAYSLGSLFEGM